MKQTEQHRAGVKKTKQILVSMTPETITKLEEISQVYGLTSRSAVIRYIVKMFKIEPEG